jgi:PAS domain S-box-containing protein
MPKAKPLGLSMLLRISDCVPALVALYDINTGEYLYVNKAVKRLLGYTPKEFTDGGLEFAVSLVHPEDIGPLMKKNQKALDAATLKPADSDEPIVGFDYRMRHKNGTWRWMHTDGTIFSRKNGRVERILNVSLDITERKSAELQLARSLKILESVF